MLLRSALTMVPLALASWMFPVSAQVFDLGKYLDLKGQSKSAGSPISSVPKAS
jgi:hypothetical protein